MTLMMPMSSTPLEFELDTVSTIPDALIARVDIDPQAHLLSRLESGREEEVSAREFLSDILARAKGLMKRGVGPGVRVGIFGPTSYDWTVMDFAISFAGGISVPFYDTSSRDQVAWILEDAGVTIAAAQDEEYAQRLREAAAGDIELVVWDNGCTELIAEGRSVSDDELAQHRSAVQQADVATIIYTSGTTGKSRGCELTHANFVQTVQAARAHVPEVFYTGARCLLFLPTAHVFARFIQTACIIQGVVLAHEADLSKLTDSLGLFRPTFILGVPRVFEKVFNAALQNAESSGKGKIFSAAEKVAVAYSEAKSKGKVPLGLKLQHAVFDKLVYSKLRNILGGQAAHAVSGGGPLGTRLGHFYAGVGIDVLEGYGLTETTAPISVNTPGRSRIGTVGTPLPGCSVALAPDGEILAKGVCVFKNYLHNDEATKNSFVDGWFRTGDMGSIDEDGFITITGRKKELIVTAGGKNVAPAPLEDIIRRHPVVGQPVVIGEGQKFVSALIFLDSEMLPGWLESKGLPNMSLEEAAKHERVQEAVQRVIDRANKTVSRAESIRSFRILPVELTVENGYLSAKQSVKRHLVTRDFAEAIDDIYAQHKPAE